MLSFMTLFHRANLTTKKSPYAQFYQYNSLNQGRDNAVRVYMDNTNTLLTNSSRPLNSQNVNKTYNNNVSLFN